MKSYAYFPGCSQTKANRAYDVSSRSVAAALGVELRELDDWNCCGASAYLSIDDNKALALSARNLALAEKTSDELVTVCSGCYLVLHKTNKILAGKPRVRERIDHALEAADLSYHGGVKVRHFLDVLVNDIGRERIEEAVTRPLEGLKVAAYYGCQLSRPYGEIDDPEFPVSMDFLARWLGGEPTPFPYRAKCCGGTSMTTSPEVGASLTGKILDSAISGGADCIITACPLCQLTLEAYQKKVSRQMGKKLSIPVLYFTQLMGNAFGLTEKELLLKDSLTAVPALLS
ncbi:CoB--CoM heterodisulfide reductase iron-sulfur subunit B family protein [bacterium]|nr:CoB--CoM heterodisulfide reductase iron-sulfur subunit B family protein [bacterium]